MDNTDAPIRVLVVCTANRCRSQMAEGWLRHFADKIQPGSGSGSGQRRIEARSAGTAPKGVHPLAVETMREAGVDLSQHTSQHIDDFANEPFDLVVTVCERAQQACPTAPGPGPRRTIHRAFQDPDDPTLNDQQLRPLFRQVRDQIRDWAQDLVRDLSKTPATAPNG